MAVTVERITVSSTAVALNPTSTGGQFLIVNNVGATPVDIGPSDVTAGDGFFFSPTDSIQLTVKPGDVLYAIRNAGVDGTVTVLRT